MKLEHRLTRMAATVVSLLAVWALARAIDVKIVLAKRLTSILGGTQPGLAWPPSIAYVIAGALSAAVLLAVVRAAKRTSRRSTAVLYAACVAAPLLMAGLWWFGVQAPLGAALGGSGSLQGPAAAVNGSHQGSPSTGSSAEASGSVSATAYAEALNAVTRSAVTPGYDPSGSPEDAGGVARCFVCEVASVDASRGAVSLDPVECFLGEDASREAREDGKDANTVVYVRNAHKRTDSLPITTGAQILVRNGAGLSGLTVSTEQEAERMLVQGELGERPLFLVGLGPEGVEFLCQLYTP